MMSLSSALDTYKCEDTDFKTCDDNKVVWRIGVKGDSAPLSETNLDVTGREDQVYYCAN